MNSDERNTQLEGIYEQLLILRCQVGDELAFNELLSRYQSRLELFVRRLMQDSDVEDVLQEIWLDVFKGLPRLRESEAFRGWLYRIARDRVAQRHRRRKNRELPLQEILAPAMESDEDDFRSRIPELEAALRTLNPEHNEVLVLRYLEDLSYEEIAALTSSPVGTVRSRLHYAKIALRATLDTEREA